MDVPNGWTLKRKTWPFGGWCYWTITRDLGHGVTTGTGGRGEPTQADVDEAVRRMTPTNTED